MYSEPHSTISIARNVNPQERVIGCFEQLRGEIENILNHDASRHNQIAELEDALRTHKYAKDHLEMQNRELDRQRTELQRQCDDLRSQLKGHRIVTLIDGDGTIFLPQLIEQGVKGGHFAASKLAESITQYLHANIGTNQYQIWVYVFFNKRGLYSCLTPNAKYNFDDFIIGFNQAAERFMMVDVGGGKEAADAKVKGLLESEIRLSQTEKIIFGGSHDNGYVTTLRSQITAGLKDKLILLPGYTEIASGISELQLPSLVIPDLFLTEKLASSPGHGRTGSGQLETNEHTLRARSGSLLAEVAVKKSPIPRAAAVVTYASGAQPYVVQRHVPTPELTSSGTSSSDVDEIGSPPQRWATSGTKHPDPNLPLSKQKPPPCTLFYLATCKRGSQCNYGHHYILSPEHQEEMVINAKKGPCPQINKGEPCGWGDNCCYGHKCPNLPRCMYLATGKCRFVGRDMHKEPK